GTERIKMIPARRASEQVQPVAMNARFRAAPFDPARGVARAAADRGAQRVETPRIRHRQARVTDRAPQRVALPGIAQRAQRCEGHAPALGAGSGEIALRDLVEDAFGVAHRVREPVRTTGGGIAPALADDRREPEADQVAIEVERRSEEHTSEL